MEAMSKLNEVSNCIIYTLPFTSRHGCGKLMPDLFDMGNFDDGQVEFSCLLTRGQLHIWG